MSNVVNLRPFVEVGSSPTLVLVDLQQEHFAESGFLARPDTVAALENCRIALAHARAAGFPIAFVRGRVDAFGRARPRSRWIDGFAPKRADMVFERNRPSCYASSAFAEVMANGTGRFVLAGFTGERACLSTAIDAFHRGHQFTFLNDASISRPLDTVPAEDVHRTVTGIIGTYGEAMRTRTWIAGTLHGKKRLGRENGNEHGRTAR